MRLSPSIRGALVFDGNSSSVQYVGEAATGSSEADPVWRIKRLSYTGGTIKITWADGDDLFDNVWTNRAGLTYL